MVGQLNLIAKCMKVGRHATNGLPFPFSSGRKSHDTPSEKCFLSHWAALWNHGVFCLVDGCRRDSWGRG